ncbi:hypothetical protein CPB84DRAFT_1229255 [Gymnopilus junonius]|uniref:Uncharacterized protein n=1 Tax=Gymnopilus junonius TaxID=109634 RepID=A0A9P5P003_GYMJU|nr:hypothetical protein CPB84DRAFT_1229255 [Gymnopilus junonius]
MVTVHCSSALSSNHVMDNSLQTESTTADGQGQGQQSKLDALRKLQEENRRLMSNNEALIADIMHEQDCEVERFARENAALSAENPV